MKRTKEEKDIKEIRVNYGETRPARNEFEFDRIDVGITRALKPGEDYEKAMEDELELLQDFVKAYMRGDT